MKPVTASVRINRSREDVFSFLDVLANHALFSDHMLVDWSFEATAAGVGAKARMRANLPGEQWMAIEVLESVSPIRTVEESVGARGKRRTRGTYTLDELPDGTTDVHFRLEVIEAPLSERLAAPLVRAYVKRANAKAIRRLGQTLTVPHEPAGPPQPRLVKFLTPWERRHPRLFAGMRIGGGISLLIIATILLGYDVWWGVLLVPVAAVCFYAAYRNPRAIRATRD